MKTAVEEMSAPLNRSRDLQAVSKKVMKQTDAGSFHPEKPIPGSLFGNFQKNNTSSLEI